MFKKLLSVGKGHSSDKLQQQQQQQNLFQLNEIKSYGFSHFCCLGYSSTLSLLAVGSKTGLLRVFGTPSVEFSYQLETGNAIRQIEFIDCRNDNSDNNNNQQQKQQQNNTNNINSKDQDQGQQPRASSTSAKLVVLTDNGQLHLFELKTIRQLTVADNSTQTEQQQQQANNNSSANDCCQQQAIGNNNNNNNNDEEDLQKQKIKVPEYTRLEYVGLIDYFTFNLEDSDRSKRVTTLEISADGLFVFVGTEGGNLYQVPLDKFEPIKQSKENKLTSSSGQRETGVRPILEDVKEDETTTDNLKTKSDTDDETTAVNLNDEPQIEQESVEPFEMIKFDEDVSSQIGDDVKPKKQGAIESIKKHPASNDKLLVSYHRGLSILYDINNKVVDKYFYHNQILESSCFANAQSGDSFYTSHNDGSYIKWETKKGSQSKPDEDFIGQLYGPYPCKPTPKILACTGLMNDQAEDLIVFSGGMPRATYDDKNPVTIVRADPSGKNTIKTVLDFTSKVLDFVVITRPRGNLGAGAKSTSSGGGGGKKNKNKQQQQQQQQRNQQIAVALAILAEEEFTVIDLLNSDSYLEFPLPYLNCVQPSAITCNQHYSDIGDELYGQLLSFNRLQLKGKYSQNEWPITGGKVIDAPDVKSHDILLTGHEDGSVNIWDVSDLSMRHLMHLGTAQFFSTEDDDLVPIDDQQQQNTTMNSTEDNGNERDAWPPLKRVGRFDPYSDDTRLAIRRISLCPRTGTLLVAGTGGQTLVFELKDEPQELQSLQVDEVTIVSDQRFTWKGREKLNVRSGVHKFEPGYQLVSYVQLNPPASATSTDLRSDWHLFAVGTSYGFLLYDYVAKHSVVNRCTLNVQDFAIVSGDAGAMSRKKSFRKSLRESFRRLRRGRSQRAQQQQTGTSSTGGGTTSPDGSKSSSGLGGRPTTGIRSLNSAAASNDTAQQAAAAHRNLYSGERQVEIKVELSSIVKCITFTSAVITNNNPTKFKPSLWIGTNSGQVLVYAIDLASEQQQQTTTAEPTTRSASPSQGDATSTTNNAAADEQQQNSTATTASSSEATTTTTTQASAIKTVARLVKEVQLKHRAPIIAIFTSPEAPNSVASVERELDSSASNSAKSTPEKHSSGLFNATSNGSTSTTTDKAVGSSENVASDAESKTAAATTTTTDGQAAPPSGVQQSAQAMEESPSKQSAKLANEATTLVGQHQQQPQQQPRVLICSEEQFKVFNLPNMKPFCKFKLTAHEGLRAKKLNITQQMMVCMSNQGDCAIYSVPDLKRQAQIQVCKREDVNGITSAMLTNYGEGYYLKSSSNFLRFSISTQRVMRVLSVV